MSISMSDELADAEFNTVSSVAVGRHSSLVDDASCTHAVKKEVLVRTDSVEPVLYVRSECDDCGVIEMSQARYVGVDVAKD